MLALSLRADPAPPSIGRQTVHSAVGKAVWALLVHSAVGKAVWALLEMKAQFRNSLEIEKFLVVK